MFKNIKTADRFNFTDASFTEVDKKILSELKGENILGQEDLKILAEQKTKIDLSALTDFMKFQKMHKKAVNKDLKLAIVD